MKRMIVTAAFALAVFALPVMGSARGYYQQPCGVQACAPAPVCAPKACAPSCSTCFNPLGIVGDVFRGVGSVVAGVGSIFGTTCTTNCY